MGLVGAGLLVILNVNYGVPYWLALGMALAVGSRLRRGHRADRHPPAVPGTARDRARGDDRRRPALARHPEPVSQPGRRGPPVPAGGRGKVDGGGRAGHRTAGHGAGGRAASRRRSGLGAEPHRPRSGGARRGRQPGPGPPRRREPEDRVHLRVGRDRVRRHRLDGAPRRPQRGSAAASPRSARRRCSARSWRH